MLHMLLLVLKIIGIILLVICSMILLSILLICVVPIRYRVKGESYEVYKVKGNVTWLLHMIRVSFSYDKTFFVSVRIFGFPLSKRKVKKLKRKGKEVVTHFGEEVEEEFLQIQEISNLEEKEQKAQAREQGKAKHKNERKKEKKGFFLKIKEWFNRLIKTLERMLTTLSEVRMWFLDEKNQKTLKLAKRQLKKILSHVLPIKIKGTITFGFDDPYTTGKILSYVSIFYPLYYKKLQLYPVFDHSILSGDLYLKGRIRLGSLLYYILRMLFDKNFRKLIKQWI